MYKNGFGIKKPTMVDMPSNQTKETDETNFFLSSFTN